MVPHKVKLGCMEKTIVGLLPPTAANNAQLDSSTQVLLANYRDLCHVQRDGLTHLLQVKDHCITVGRHCFPWVFFFVAVIGMVKPPLPKVLLKNGLQ